MANGAEVIAVDKDEDIVNDAANELPYCKCADITNPEVIKRLGIANVDVAVIAMATHLEASIMATMFCKEIGVKTVIAKCANETNCRILTKVGADKVVLPERVSMVELAVRPEWEGRSLIELNLRKKYSVNVVAIMENGRADSNIDPEKPLNGSMRLIVMANPARLAKLK